MGFLYSQFFVTPSLPTQSFEGQTVIVTGSNVGLGLEAARHFARLKASTVILAVRDVDAGQRAKIDILSSTRCDPDALQVWELDLKSFASCQTFAKRAAGLQRIDVLVQNAGIAPSQWSLAERHESTILVNVISTFFLSFLLLPALKSTSSRFNTTPHLVVVTSEVHSWCKFPQLDDVNIFTALDDKASFVLNDRYPLSKLLQVLLVRRLARETGSGIIVNMLNPGLCHSRLARDAGVVLAIMKFFLARSTEVGSRTIVLAAQAGPETNGKYMHDGVLTPEEPTLSPFVKSSQGFDASEKVWQDLKTILNSVQPGVTSAVE